VSPFQQPRQLYADFPATLCIKVLIASPFHTYAVVSIYFFSVSIINFIIKWVATKQTDVFFIKENNTIISPQKY